MLLRQFISASNAVEEIYIVKKETDSDGDDENPPLNRLLPESGIVPASMTLPGTIDGIRCETFGTGGELPDVVEIKSELEDGDDDDTVRDDQQVVSPSGIEVDAAGQQNLKTESNVGDDVDEDNIPLAQRKKKIRRITRKKLSLKKCETSSDSFCAVNTIFSEGSTSSDEESKVFKESLCNICSTKFDKRQELIRHLRKFHCNLLPFRCEVCVSGEQKSLGSLNKHFALHDPLKPFKCYYCAARFSAKIHRTAHQRRYHREDLENDTIRNANRRFVCRYCNKRFAAKFNLERHERGHEVKITANEQFPDRRHQCFLCVDSKPFSSKDELIQHLTGHVDKLPYVCNRCDQPTTITSIRLLNKHLASHEEPEQPIKCVYCSKRFISVMSCQTHERTHVQEKEADEVAVAKLESKRISAKIIIVDGMKRYECSYCGNSYSLLSTLRRHENIHTGKVQYVCKVCGKIFNKSSCLLQHERTHSQDTPYKCEICNRGFKETIRLIEHRRIHSGERPFTCRICFKSFRIKPLLKEHELMCGTKQENIESRCPICSATFPNYRLLADHCTGSHPAAIEETRCEYCDLTFKDTALLIEHENNHRNPNSIRCGECSRIFKQLSNLRRHQRLHSNDAIPYQCDICGKSFSQAGALKIHKRIHSGEKPYQCDLCSKTFYHSSTMQRHKKSHFKSKSKLFLFGEQQEKPKDEESAPTMVDSLPAAAVEPAISASQSMPTLVLTLGKVIKPLPMFAKDKADSIPLTVESHQPPTIPQTIGNGMDTLANLVVQSRPEMYVLDTKLLIPQTVIQHQQQQQDIAKEATIVNIQQHQQL
ncbi:zinc finger protein 135-like [Uranotaenia lowii]|uniref:zinc finger protein 135-like n=1 Tax=Uranotaenia lowii TaxID=190385 RepID=UPI00247A8A01|nr:zinc finger protein 135-like [Uranotaenia lowii]